MRYTWQELLFSLCFNLIKPTNYVYQISGVVTQIRFIT